MRNSECGVRSLTSAHRFRRPNEYSAFRTPHSALGGVGSEGGGRALRWRGEIHRPRRRLEGDPGSGRRGHPHRRDLHGRRHRRGARRRGHAGRGGDGGQQVSGSAQLLFCPVTGRNVARRLKHHKVAASACRHVQAAHLHSDLILSLSRRTPASDPARRSAWSGPRRSGHCADGPGAAHHLPHRVSTWADDGCGSSWWRAPCASCICQPNKHRRR